MSKQIRKIVIPFILAFTAPTYAREGIVEENPEVRRGDFGWSVELEIPEGRAPVKLEVPEFVYRHVHSPDLYDIRVFNGEEEIVPHAVKSPGKEMIYEDKKSSIPFFPVYEVDEGSSPEDISILVQRGPSGSVVEVKTLAGQTAGKRLSYYLLDTYKIKYITNLELKWAETGDSTVIFLDVDESQDLTSWVNISRKNPVFRMKYGEHEIERHTIENIYLSQNRYLRIKPAGGDGVFSLKSVTAVSRVSNKAAERDKKIIKKVSREKDHSYIFDSEGVFPADYLRFTNIPLNTGFEYKIYSRKNLDDEWTFRRQGLVYSIEADGSTIKQDTAEIPNQMTRYWKVEWLDSEARFKPEIEIGWFPHRIVFFPSGNPPYRLAYGNSGISEDRSTIDRLLAEIENANGGSLQYRNAKPGKMIFVEKGFKAIEAGKGNAGPKMILWIALGITVVFLSFMAKSLFAQLQKVK